MYKTVVKNQYELAIFIDVVSPESGEVIDTQTEIEHYDTLSEAERQAEKYHKGDVICEWGDGCQGVVSDVYVDVDPKPIEYFEKEGD